MPGLILPYKGKLPKIAEGVFVAETAVIIGDVEIGPDTNIWYGCVLRGDVHHIRVGARCNIQDGTIVHVTTGRSPTIIGDDVTVGHMALLHGCHVQSGGFIGMRATVMDDAVVESGAWVGAGALVTPKKIVPSGQLWAGSPAKYLRDVTDMEKMIMKGTVPHYVELAKSYMSDSNA